MKTEYPGAQRADKPKERSVHSKPERGGSEKLFHRVGEHAKAKYPGVQVSDHAEDGSHSLENPDKYHSGHDALCDEAGYTLLTKEHE